MIVRSIRSHFEVECDFEIYAGCNHNCCLASHFCVINFKMEYSSLEVVADVVRIYACFSSVNGD